MTTEAFDGEKRLYEELFEGSGYKRDLRPRHDPNQTVVVDMELDLNHLIKLVRSPFTRFNSILSAAGGVIW